MCNFREQILEVVNTIPEGKVASYGQVALIAGVARGARQVGRILCHFGEKYPWWRVINNAGRISTTCLDHTSLAQKERLMDEGVFVNEKLQIDIEGYRWRPDPETLKKLQLDDDYIQKIMEKYFQ